MRAPEEARAALRAASLAAAAIGAAEAALGVLLFEAVGREVAPSFGEGLVVLGVACTAWLGSTLAARRARPVPVLLGGACVLAAAGLLGERAIAAVATLGAGVGEDGPPWELLGLAALGCLLAAASGALSAALGRVAAGGWARPAGRMAGALAAVTIARFPLVPEALLPAGAALAGAIVALGAEERASTRTRGAATAVLGVVLGAALGALAVEAFARLGSSGAALALTVAAAEFMRLSAWIARALLAFRRGEPTSPSAPWVAGGVPLGALAACALAGWLGRPPAPVAEVGHSLDPAGRAHRQRLAHLAALATPRLASALVLRLGTGETAGALLRHRPDRLDVLAPAAGIVAARRRGAGALSDPALHAFEAEPRAFLRRTRRVYDVITLEPPDRGLEHALCTRELYALARRRLSPEGVMAQSVPARELADDAAAGLVHAFVDAFPEARLVLGPDGRAILLGAARPWTLREPAIALEGGLEALLGEPWLDTDGVRLFGSIAAAWTDRGPVQGGDGPASRTLRELAVGLGEKHRLGSVRRRTGGARGAAGSAAGVILPVGVP